MKRQPQKGGIYMSNILEMINTGEITNEQAYDIMDKITDKFHDGEIDEEIPKVLCLDKYEWTAICHSLDLSILAEWRKKGWPTKCNFCGKEVDYKKFNWFIKNNKLMCMDCS
jgi:hypothetical protein